MVYLFMADGFEEVEALTVVDILRRAGVELKTVSIMGRKNVTGSHQIEVMADLTFEEIIERAEMLILPGGMPGTLHLKAHKGLEQLIFESAEHGTYLAAICAAPTVYGEMGLLRGKKAACYPGMEDGLIGAEVRYENVVADDKFITSRGLGTAIDFAIEIIKILASEEISNQVKESILA